MRDKRAKTEARMAWNPAAWGTKTWAAVGAVVGGVAGAALAGGLAGAFTPTGPGVSGGSNPIVALYGSVALNQVEATCSSGICSQSGQVELLAVPAGMTFVVRDINMLPKVSDNPDKNKPNAPLVTNLTGNCPGGQSVDFNTVICVAVGGEAVMCRRWSDASSAAGRTRLEDHSIGVPVAAGKKLAVVVHSACTTTSAIRVQVAGLMMRQ